MSSRLTVGLTKENHELLKKAAVRRGVNMSVVANAILQEFGVADRDEKVILTIPSNLTKRNKEGFKEWVRSRMDALMNAYYPDTHNAIDT